MSQMLDYKQAATMVGVPLGTLYCWVATKRIPHVRLGPRLVRFRRDELEQWIDRHRVVAVASE